LILAQYQRYQSTLTLQIQLFRGVPESNLKMHLSTPLV